MKKLKINKRENILQESGDYLFKIDLTLLRQFAESSPYISVDYTVEFLNNGDIKDVNNIAPEDYRNFIIPKIYNQLDIKKFEIDALFQQQIIT